MGSRIFPFLAIAFMNKLEKSCLNGSAPEIYYFRYVDDIFICTFQSDVLLGINDKLNGAHSNIKLTRNDYDNEGWLLFLNSEVKYQGGVGFKSRIYGKKPLKTSS